MSNEVDDILTEFYGIDPITRKVESVAISQTGKLSRWTDRKGYIVRQMTGDDARSEVTRILGLIELVEVHPRTSWRSCYSVLYSQKSFAG